LPTTQGFLVGSQVERQVKLTGSIALVCFLGLIPLANWMIGHVGTACSADGPCLVPVAPGIMAPSGVLTVGAALVLRDVVQRCLGLPWGVGAILAGTLLSVLVAPPSLVIASGTAFLMSELADFGVYTPLQRRRLVCAVIASSGVGLTIDSIVFLSLAFGSLHFLAGQVIGKLWAVLVSIPFIRLLRRMAPSPA
jgi:queuosine precursor transporter